MPRAGRLAVCRESNTVHPARPVLSSRRLDQGGPDSAARRDARCLQQGRSYSIGRPLSARVVPAWSSETNPTDALECRTNHEAMSFMSSGPFARMLVEMHDGTIAVHSDGPSRGSEFTIRLPVKDVPAGTVSELEEDLSDGPPRRILIVEDNRDSRETLTRRPKLKGHHVRGVGDGPSTLDVALTWCPEVVILHSGLPGMSGHEVARQLRQRPALREVVLIALTDWGQEQDRQRSSAAGIAHHLTEPVDPDRLDRLLGALGKP
jgi:CheY-like chemotaxis protein